MSEAAAMKVSVGRSLAASEVLIFEGVEGSVRLRVGIDVASSRLIIHEATHVGTADPLMKRTLDRLCEIIVRRPVQEAADHGVIYVAAANLDDCSPVEEIRTPRSSGRAFAMAERLLRQVNRAVQVHLNVGHRDNAWYLRASERWLAQNKSANSQFDQADCYRLS